MKDNGFFFLFCVFSMLLFWHLGGLQSRLDEIKIEIIKLQQIQQAK